MKTTFTPAIIWRVFIILSLCLPFQAYSDQSDDLTDDLYMDIGGSEEGVSIFGTRNSGQDKTTLKKSEIEKLNPETLSDLLTRGFGLSIKNNGGNGNLATVNIRGFSGSRILILINGVPMNSGQSGDFDLSMIDVNAIEEIEVVKGGSDTKYGYSGAIGGIINIITKKKEQAEYTVYGSISNKFYYPDFYYTGSGTLKNKQYYSMWYDFFDTQNLSSGFSIGSEKIYYDLSLSGMRAYNHYIYQDSYDIKRRRTHNEIWDGSAQNTLSFSLPNYTKVILSGSFYYGNKNIPGAITSAYPGKQIDYLGNGTFSLDADCVGSENIDTELTASYKHQTTDWEDSYGHSIHHLHTLFGVNRWGFYINSRLKLTAGADITYDYLDSNTVGTRQLINGGTYLSTDITLHPKVVMTPYVQIIYNKEYPVAIPKLSTVVAINDYLTFKNNFFRVFRTPSINDLYWPADGSAEGNPDLKNEDGFGGDAILSYANAKLFKAESSFYATYSKDAILWQSSNGIWSPDNVGSALYIGSDTSIHSLFSKYIELSLNYAFLLTYVLDEGFTFESDKRMPYKPMHILGMSVLVNWISGTIAISGNYQSERYVSTLNVNALPALFTLDIDISQKIPGHMTLFCSIKNALNHFYYLTDGYPATNGSVTAGIKFNYKGKIGSKEE